MKYELLFMIKPSLTEDQARKSVELVKDLVSEAKGKVEKEDFWGKRKLAYEVKRMQEAYYTVFNLDVSQSQIKEIASSLSQDKDIFRYLITKTG